MKYKFTFEEKLYNKTKTDKKRRIINKSQDVVLLRMDLIGDCTMFTSTAYAIREFFRDRSMTVICLQSTKNIFERMGVFEEVISIDIKPDNVNQAIAKGFVKDIQEREYDILLQPQASRYPIADVIAAAISANKKIAIDLLKDNCGEEWSKYDAEIYDEFVPFPPNIVSEFDYYGAFARGIGLNYETIKPRLPYYETNIIKGKYYVLYPGGSLSVKFWPAEKFATIADYIYKKKGYVCVILGTQHEEWIFEKLRQTADLRTRMSMVNLMGKTNIFDVIDIIGNAQLVVTNDTSGVHIACATNTPSVATVGGWCYGRFLPYNIEKIDVDDKLPLVANKMLDCYMCNWDRKKVRETNPSCVEDLNSGRPCQCISDIPVGTVKMLVDRVIGELEKDGKA